MGRLRLLGAMIGAAGLLVLGLWQAANAPSAGAQPDCASPDVSAPRDPANPLALPTRPPSGDPLQGAHFFVDGPKHGQAAADVAQALGENPKRFSDDYSWDQFKSPAQFNGKFSRADRGVKRRITALEKIANQEEPQNVSLFAEGGGPGAIYGQTHKLLCDNMSADHTPATVMVFTTYFIYPNGQFCPDLSAIKRWQGTFHRDVDEMASAIGTKRAVIFEDIDGIGASSCLNGQSLNIWLGDLRYESKRFSGLAHAVTSAEAGYSDAQGPAWTATRLWRAGVNQVRGFYTNGTHFAWSIDEIRWAQDVSDRLYVKSHGHYRARFVVNTAQNGHGPKVPANRVKQGNEDLCNPSGRGLGRLPTGQVHPTFDGKNFQYLDGFMWTGVPGRSHNSNCPNGPWRPGGVFDPRFAAELGQNANQKLGPGFPSQPY